MAEITAALVKDLREKTGAGMMDCKQALTETGGDMEAAVDWLRKKGLAAAAKKSGPRRRRGAGRRRLRARQARRWSRSTPRPTSSPATRRSRLSSRAVAKLALTVGDDLDAIKAAPFPGTGRTVAEQLTHLVATIGENMTLRRAKRAERRAGRGRDLRAQRAAAGAGQDRRAGRDRGQPASWRRWRRSAARSACTSRPRGPRRSTSTAVDPAALEREKAVLIEQARAVRQAGNIIEKMVEGRIRKFYEEVVLLEQVWVHDGESRVRAVLQEGRRQAAGLRALPAGRRHRQAKAAISPPRSPRRQM